MKKAKIWKIGTHIESYIDEFMEWIDKYHLKIDDNIFLIFNPKNKIVYFKFGKEEDLESAQQTKATQMIKVLITLNILKPLIDKTFIKDIEMVDSINYKLISNANNWRENFIKNISELNYLNEVDEDEKNINNFYFSSQKDALYSIMKSFELFENEEISKYSSDDQKSFKYWQIKELFKPFNNELKELINKLIYPITSPIIKMSDMEKIEWKEFKISKLEDVKDGKIESSLWNLADILSTDYDISIPIMQRKYVWNENLVDKLLDDIFEINNDKSLHYIGSIVYKEKNTVFKILDGQQRLTTMFIILAAINAIYSSQEANFSNIKVPLYLRDLFPFYTKNSKKSLHERFKRVSGNDDFQEFYEILEKGQINKEKKSNMSKNFDHSKSRIILNFRNEKSDEQKQDFLDRIFRNVIERIAFTANKNQIESEYIIFEKLNTLSEPLNQIDLLKNYLLPFCKEEDLDKNEQIIQKTFEDKIFKKFEKNKEVSKPAVTKFVNYFINLYENILDDKLDENQSLKNEYKKMKPFNKMSFIIQEKYELNKFSLNTHQFLELLEKIEEEIILFLSITDKSYYTNPENIFYEYSDILISFEQRYVYAPLIKIILEKENSILFKSDKKQDRESINRIRKILFEIERYELFFQVVLYRGQSISGLIEKIIKEVIKNYSENNFTSEIMREIFKNNKILSSGLVSPEIEMFAKKIEEEPIADKVSILILNRMKFYFNNNNSIELNEVFNFNYLKKPSREHIISQTINDNDWRKEIFNRSTRTSYSKEFNDNEFNRMHKTYLNMIGNILMVESSDNSEFNNKTSKKKANYYKMKTYLEKDPAYIGINNEYNNSVSLKKYIESNELSFDDIQDRSKAISKYLIEIYK